MYEYFEGTIQAVTPAYIVIDVNGIGFRLLVANPYDFEAGKQTRIYVQLIIRENDHFTDLKRQRINELLTSCYPSPALVRNQRWQFWQMFQVVA